MSYPKFTETDPKIIYVDEWVEMKWVPSIKFYYEELGYKYTKMFDTFVVHVDDLPSGSAKKVNIKCPLCNHLRDIEYKTLHKQGHSYCNGCSRSHDLRGYTFNHLAPLVRVGTDGDSIWKCECKCGSYTEVRAADLKNGRVRSCGCINIDDLTGMVFGRWAVIEYAGSIKGNSRWVCECKCGSTKEVYAHSLKRGNSTSCGCYDLELKKLG